MQLCQSIIGGAPRQSGQAPIDKFYAATGEVIAKVEPATPEMLDDAVAIAAEAQKDWAVAKQQNVLRFYTVPPT